VVEEEEEEEEEIPIQLDSPLLSFPSKEHRLGDVNPW
jgi:hypothetical protein